MKIKNTRILAKFAMSSLTLERTLELVGEKMSITPKTFHPEEGSIQSSYLYVPSPEPYFIGLKQYEDTQVSNNPKHDHNLILFAVSYSHRLNMTKFEEFRKIEGIKFLESSEETEKVCLEKFYPVFMGIKTRGLI